jgi:hypothetical protein
VSTMMFALAWRVGFIVAGGEVSGLEVRARWRGAQRLGNHRVVRHGEATGSDMTVVRRGRRQVGPERGALWQS